jgi:hypothetical protein
VPTDFAIPNILAERLPLPLAQLLQRACYAKTPLDRHLAAFHLWEAFLKLIGATAIAQYADRERDDPQASELLKSLACPTASHWWEIVRKLLPMVAAADPAMIRLRDVLLREEIDDLPRASTLDAALREILEGRRSASQPLMTG